MIRFKVLNPLQCSESVLNFVW